MATLSSAGHSLEITTTEANTLVSYEISGTYDAVIVLQESDDSTGYTWRTRETFVTPNAIINSALLVDRSRVKVRLYAVSFTSGAATIKLEIVSNNDSDSGNDTIVGGGIENEANDLTEAVTWAPVPDTSITQSSVKQHQAALAIDATQIVGTTALSSLTFPERITFKDEATSAAADAGTDNDPLASAGRLLPRRVRNFDQVVTMDLHVAEVLGTDTNKAVKVIDVNNSNATVVGPVNLGASLASSHHVGLDPSAYIASIDPETTVDLALVSAGTGTGGNTIIVTGAELVLWRQLAATGAVLGTTEAIPEPTNPAELPAPTGNTAATNSGALAYNSANYTVRHIDQLTTAIHGGLTASGSNLVATVTPGTVRDYRSALDVLGCSISQSTLGENAGQSFGFVTTGQEAWNSNAPASVRTRLKSLNIPSLKGQFFFEGYCDSVAFLAQELTGSTENVLWNGTPRLSGALTAAQQADKIYDDTVSLTSYIYDTKGYNFRYNYTDQEPYGHSKMTPQEYADVVRRVGVFFRNNYPQVWHMPDVNRAAGNIDGSGLDAWRQYVIDAAMTHIDGASPHDYDIWDTAPLDSTEEIIGRNAAMINKLQMLVDQFGDASDGLIRYVWPGEWGFSRKTGNFGRDSLPFNNGHIAQLHLITRMMYMLRMEGVRGASLWGVASGQETVDGTTYPKRGLIPTWSTTDSSMMEWAYRLVREHWQPLIPQVTGTCPFYAGTSTHTYQFASMSPSSGLEAPYVPFLALTSLDRRTVTLIAVNGDNISRDAQITIDDPLTATVASAQKLETANPTTDVGFFNNTTGAGYKSDFASSISNSDNVLSWTMPAFTVVAVQVNLS